MKYAAIVFSVIVCLAASVAANAKDKSAGAALDMKECPFEMVKFDDGDSLFCGDEEIRVIGIDTPEIIHEQHGIFIDQPMGRKVAEFTNNELKNAKNITLIRSGKDKYGRTLAFVLIDGELLEVKLLKKGYAYENISKYGDNGQPALALQITDAAKVSPKPKFENPHDWRKKNQKKVEETK